MTQHTLVSPKVEVLHGFGRWSVTRHRLCTVALVLSAVRWRGSTEVLGLSHWVFFIKTGIIAKATVFWHLLSSQHASRVTYLFLSTPYKLSFHRSDYE